MTESTAVGTRGFNTKKCRKFSSVGLLGPNMEAKVMDWNTGSFLPPGSCGELWLRGPAVMKGEKTFLVPQISLIDLSMLKVFALFYEALFMFFIILDKKKCVSVYFDWRLSYHR